MADDADDFAQLSDEELEEIHADTRRRYTSSGRPRSATAAAREDARNARQRYEFEEAERADLRDRQRAGRVLTTGGRSSDGAGFVLGLVGWALVLAYFRGGVPAVRGWVAAKFLNKPYTGPLDDLRGRGRTGAPGNAAPARTVSEAAAPGIQAIQEIGRRWGT